jgi:hypothetical protein
VTRNHHSRISAAALLVLSIASWGQANNTPSQTWKAYISAVEQNRLDDAVKMISSTDRKMMGDGLLKSGLAEFGRSVRVKGIASFSTYDETVQGDHATVSATLVYKNGSQDKDTQKFVKEPDGWKLIVSSNGK